MARAVDSDGSIDRMSKTRSVDANTHTRATREVDSRGDEANADTDEMTMILIPRSAWIAVEALATKLGVLPGEAMGIAMKRLEADLDGGKDGA